MSTTTLPSAYRELRKQYPDVPAHIALAWARTRLEILAHVGGDYDARGVYGFTVDLPGMARVWVTMEPDDDDCALGDGCEAHEHAWMAARCPDRASVTILASVGAVCVTGGSDDYEYHAGLALDLAREAHAQADSYERGVA
jgi:hypothetical protein